MRNKYMAAFLALFLGWIGVHKFYLGKWGQGMFYILGMVTTIPFFISIIECIIYLSHSEEWFDIKYNTEYIVNKSYLDSLMK